MAFIATAWAWLTNNPIARTIGIIVLALIGWNVVKRNIQETGRIKERERIAAAQAEVRARTAERVSSIITEETHRADEAISARDSGAHYPTADGMPDPLRRVAIRGQGGDQTS